MESMDGDPRLDTGQQVDMCPLPSTMLSALNCSLQQRQPATASWLLSGLGEPTSLTHGWLSQPPSPKILSSVKSHHLSTSTGSLYMLAASTGDSCLAAHNP